MAAPLGRVGHVGLVELSDRRAAEQLERPNQIGAQDLDGAGNARAAAGAQPVGVRAADEHGARAHAQRLRDVGAAADPAVEQHFTLAVHRRDDFGQRAQRRVDAIELASAVIGDDDALGALVHGAAGIVADHAGP